MLFCRGHVVAVCGAWCVIGASTVSTELRGQVPDEPVQLALADRGPAFFTVPRPDASRVDARNAAVLQRGIVLALRNAPLREALDAIARGAELTINYRDDVLPTDKRVTLEATNISVVAALTVVLLNAGVDVQLTGADRLALVRRGLTPVVLLPHRQAAGAIAGRVTDAVTKAPLDQVAVRVEGSGLGAATASGGRYMVRNVPSGNYHVTARRVGYTPLTKTILVATDSAATVDFALTAAPTRLNEMVTTAVGDQRRYEVGNTISTINADSIAPTAPITSLTDLISARAPGVEVIETSGMTGAGEAIRIRGLSSLVLQNDPILVVDGVRQDNAAAGDLGAHFGTAYAGNNGTHPTPTRLNDINFGDVQSIDVLKGPSASTEYGTDAANGVIVITTKHGVAGVPQWRAAAEQTVSDIPVRFPNGYYSWGHTTDGTNTAVDCPLVPVGFSPGYASTVGNCIVDSVTQWNPLNHAATSIFGTGNRGRYDLSVSGGSEAVRYFVSGGLSNEAGIIRMPPVFRKLADTANLGLPNSALQPNSEEQRSVHANAVMRLGRNADLTATGSYLSAYQQTPDAERLYQGVFYSPALNGPANYYGYGYYTGTLASATPLSQLSEIGSQRTDRITGGLTAGWRPADWFVGRGTVGLDHGSQRSQALNYPLANAAYEYFPPFLGLADGTIDVYSADFRGTATAVVSRGVRALTSGGLQMVDTRAAAQGASVLGITATNLTLNGATGPTVTQQASRQATLGGYAEEQLAVVDRVFLTGALRIDAGSGFGGAYATAAYPKGSFSWLAVDQGRTTVRVRGAFGESGVQPTSGAALRLFAPSTAYAGGTMVTTYTLNWPGNAHLRPERSIELEGGVDVGGWGNRVSVEFTAYSKTTQDALVNVNLSGSLCCYTYQENIGRVRNTGVEASATLALVQNRSVTWDVAVNASANRNKLVALAPGIADQVVNAYPAQERQAPGYPLYGLWARHVGYTDVNRDGIVEANEVTLADSVTYVGPSLPTQQASLSTHAGFWQGAVTVAGLLDYRGAYRIANAMPLDADYIGNTRQENVPGTALWLQARAVENAAGKFNALDIEDGSFIRLREVSLTYAIPQGVVRALRARSLLVTAAVRNLALWTRYTGVDPEVSNTLWFNIQTAPTTAAYQVNNDVRSNWGAVPLARYWVVRVNAGI